MATQTIQVIHRWEDGQELSEAELTERRAEFGRSCGRVGPHETEVDKHVQEGVFNW